jgi:hypothetical protein
VLTGVGWQVADREVPRRQPRRPGQGPRRRRRLARSEPEGTAEQLVAALGDEFHRDYGPVLRAVLFAVDRHRARQVTGIGVGNAGPVR